MSIEQAKQVDMHTSNLTIKERKTNINLIKQQASTSEFENNNPS